MFPDNDIFLTVIADNHWQLRRPTKWNEYGCDML